MTDFSAKLDKLAEAAIQVGLGLKSGQELLLFAPIDALPLARKVTEHAYRAGASLVTPFYIDDDSVLLRYRHAPDDSFDAVPKWLYDGMGKAYRSGAARLHIMSDNPSLLAKEDPVKVGRSMAARAKAAQPMMEPIMRWDVNWSIIAAATPTWAAVVFPHEQPDAALAKLWDAIFAATRIDENDAVENWSRHAASLRSRADHLDDKRYSALHYRGPGTDFRLGLADDHIWKCAGNTAGNGARFVANMPTEEIFTMPHKDRADGWVAASMPLSHGGALIEGMRLRFEGGRVVEARADKGLPVLEKILDTDPGSRHLGEVALVPVSSPISRSGLLFYNPLFDENASCHLALGQSIPMNLRDGATLSQDQQAAKGANHSVIHVDWMIGSNRIDIDGITSAGAAEPLMRAGEWDRGRDRNGTCPSLRTGRAELPHPALRLKSAR
ncbi:MAG TPA: aminopeptidase [Opitutaceae bacterium]